MTHKSIRDVDVIVIGGGPGGIRSARMAAHNGLSTVLFEKDSMGGTCTNRGCVPKKMINIAASVPHYLQVWQDFGWQFTPPTFTLATLQENSRNYILRAKKHYQEGLKKRGIDIINAEATIGEDNIVYTNDQEFRAQRIVIATGTTPIKPSVVGGELCSTSDDVFTLSSLPKRVVVLGAGYIACEMATMLSALGADVSLVYRGTEILRAFDHDIRRLFLEAMTQQGIKTHLSSTLEKIEKIGDGFRVTVNENQSINTIETDFVLSALGRSAVLPINSDALPSFQRKSNGFLKIDDHYQTSVKGVYAVGDIVDGQKLAPIAVRQAINLVHGWLNLPPLPLNADHVPTAVFSHPHIATVGLSEETARQKYQDVHIHTINQRPMSGGITPTAKEIISGRHYYKIVCQGNHKKIIGAHFLGEDTPELLQIFALAVAHQLTISDLKAVIAIHPTASEELFLID